MPKIKLSPEAAKRKAERDLRIAKTDDRRNKKADSQQKRREAVKDGKSVKGKDYDHNTKRFVDSSVNRAGTGKKPGTKNENAPKMTAKRKR
jgi:hypothetical protein